MKNADLVFSEILSSFHLPLFHRIRTGTISLSNMPFENTETVFGLFAESDDKAAGEACEDKQNEDSCFLVQSTMSNMVFLTAGEFSLLRLLHVTTSILDRMY